MALAQLEGSAVRLRPLQARDAEALFEAYRDQVVLRYWLSATHERVEDTMRLIEDDARAVASGDALVWGVALRESDHVVGRLTLNVDRPQRRGTIGFLLARVYWGRGLAAEAQRLVLDYSFGPLGLRRIEAYADPRNTSSLRSLERLGFRREGVMRERWLVAGEARDDVLLGLLSREWSAQRRADAALDG
jgi:RimJ/RimL family protein N-acetyltransferase